MPVIEEEEDVALYITLNLPGELFLCYRVDSTILTYSAAAWYVWLFLS
jgi:hypothetical protein